MNTSKMDRLNYLLDLRNFLNTERNKDLGKKQLVELVTLLTEQCSTNSQRNEDTKLR